MKEYIVEYETEQLGNNTFFYGGKIKRELIQCKDCKYWNGVGKFCNYEMIAQAEDYCSWAKRKENE